MRTTMIAAACAFALCWPLAPAHASEAMARYRTVIYSLIFMHTRPPHAYYVVTGSGTAHIQFCVDRDGKLLHVARAPDARPTGYDIGAIRIVKKAARDFPAPPASLKGDQFCFRIPISFRSI